MAKEHSSLSFLTLKNSFSLLVFCLFLQGCNLPEHNGYSPIENGLVQAYLIEEESGILSISNNTIGAPIYTDDSGGFKLNLPFLQSTDNIILLVTAQQDSTITCPLVEGCQSSSFSVQFGEKYPAPAGLTLKGAVPALKLGSVNAVNITPLSQLAIAKASTYSNGLTPENIAAAYAFIESTFGLAAESLHLPVPGMDSLNDPKIPDSASIKAALVANSIMGLANLPDWNDIKEVIEFATRTIENQGSLPQTNLGALSDITTEDILLQAISLAQDLMLDMEPYKQRAVQTIITEIETKMDSPADTPEEPKAITILSQPSPKTVNELEATSFGVVATGPELNYQWRKNNVPIPTANHASYNIISAEEDDIGSYDVVISNTYGAVVSSAASLTLIPLPVEEEPPAHIPAPSPVPDNPVAQPSPPVVPQPAEPSNPPPADPPVVPSNPSEPVVPPIALGRSIEITWDTPTKRVDNEDLDIYEIGGYTIAYGSSPYDLNTHIYVDGATTNSHIINGLNRGIYYFTIATTDSNGLQGNYLAPGFVIRL